jgi:hypothetical protein
MIFMGGTSMALLRFRRCLLALGGAGLTLCFLAGLSKYVEWLCVGIANGCSHTAELGLWGIPLWVWGAGFYVLIIWSLLFRPRLLFWLAASGLGIGAYLMLVLWKAEIPCVLCIANFMVLALALALCFDRVRVWQGCSTGLFFFLLSNFLFMTPASESFASLEKRQSSIVAKVEEETITFEELERPISTHIYDLQQKIHRLKRNRLDQMIGEILLRKEAEGKGITVERLVRDEVLSRGVSVTDEEVDRFYNENRARIRDWRGTEEELKTRLRESLQERMTNEMITAYAKSLRAKYEVIDYLLEPALFHANVGISATDPTYGPKDAPVTVVEFSDYRCAACRKHFPISDEIRRFYGDKIRWVFKDFPREGDEASHRAAEAAGCAAEQEKFWDYHDRLFNYGGQLNKEALSRIADQLGLDMVAFDRCFESRRKKTEIERDAEDAKAAGVAMTPSFIINGKLVPGGPPLEKLKQIIEETLAAHKGVEARN